MIAVSGTVLWTERENQCPWSLFRLSIPWKWRPAYLSGAVEQMFLMNL